MSRPDVDEDEIEASRAPLMDHLIELRGRLIVCVVAFIIAFFGCFYFAAQIQLILIHPFQAAAAMHAATGGGHHVNPFDLIAVTAGLKPVPAGGQEVVQLIATAPLEQLFTKMKIAGFGAVVVAFPVLAW